MFYVRVTIHDHNELDCRTFSYTQTFQHTSNLISLSPDALVEEIKPCIEQAQTVHRLAYPRGRNFSIPITEISVVPHEELLRAAA